MSDTKAVVDGLDPPISLARDQAAINAVVAEAKRRDWKMNVAVVDSRGNLVAFQRMDGMQLASIQIAEHKARAAATFRRETKFFEKAIHLQFELPVDARRNHCVPRRHSTDRAGQDHRRDRLFRRHGFTG